MRVISYKALGGMGGESGKTGTVADLLKEIPYLLMARIIPPLHVVNDLLGSGISDAGMSGGVRWEPFEMTPSEWNELVQHFKALEEEKRCDFVQPADWVQSIDDWHAWIMIHKYGMPEEFRILDREVRDLEHARAQALRDGNQKLVADLHLRVIEAGEKLAEFVMVHRKNAGGNTGDNGA